MGERNGVSRVFVGKPQGGNHLEDPDVDGRIILDIIGLYKLYPIFKNDRT
jgi:hypothetical protein